jgi:hypothetical protein
MNTGDAVLISRQDLGSSNTRQPPEYLQISLLPEWGGIESSRPQVIKPSNTWDSVRLLLNSTDKHLTSFSKPPSEQLPLLVDRDVGSLRKPDPPLLRAITDSTYAGGTTISRAEDTLVLRDWDDDYSNLPRPTSQYADRANITVRTLVNETIVLESISLRSTVDMVKTVLHEKTGFPPDQQKLFTCEGGIKFLGKKGQRHAHLCLLLTEF